MYTHVENRESGEIVHAKRDARLSYWIALRLCCTSLALIFDKPEVELQCAFMMCRRVLDGDVYFRWNGVQKEADFLGVSLFRMLNVVRRMSYLTWRTYNFPVDREAANLLRTCHGETGVMDFGFKPSTSLQLPTATLLKRCVPVPPPPPLLLLLLFNSAIYHYYTVADRAT